MSSRLIPRTLLAACCCLSATPLAGVETVVTDMSELDAAISAAAAGDVIVMKNGTWKDAGIRFRARGREGMPVTIRAEDGGKVILTGSSHLVFDGEWLVVDGLKLEHLESSRVFVEFEDGSRHCRLTESAILDSDNGGRNWVHLRKGVGHRIDHCRFSGMDQKGMQIQVETEPDRRNDHRIDNNFFGHRARGRGNGFETIRIGYSHQQDNVSGTTVERNLFYKCDGELEIISNKSTGNRFLRNTFLDCRGQLTCRHGDRAWIEGNFFLSGDSGIRLIGEEHVVVNNYFGGLRDYGIVLYNGVPDPEPTSYEQVRAPRILFNTFVDCSPSIVIGSGRGSLPPRDVVIANNVAWTPSGTVLSKKIEPDGIRYEGNIFHGRSLGITVLEDESVSWRDPRLVKSDDGIYRPAAVSPIHDAAAGEWERVTEDINGFPRGEKKDVGAHEIGATDEPRGPLTEEDVGPLWMRNRSP